MAGKNGTTPTPTDGNKVSARAYDPAVDYIVGNPNAKVVVIEYADLECPYCITFNETMHQVMGYYGSSGNVAWIYRNFPLASLHSKAPKEAEATECAGAQGGSAAYYKMIDGIYAVTPGSNGLDLAQLPVIAGQIGLNVEQFNQCLSSGQFTEKVQKSYNEAIATGAEGTPYVLIMAGGESVELSGAQPYSSMRAAIDAVLSGIGASATTTQ